MSGQVESSKDSVLVPRSGARKGLMGTELVIHLVWDCTAFLVYPAAKESAKYLLACIITTRLMSIFSFLTVISILQTPKCENVFSCYIKWECEQ